MELDIDRHKTSFYECLLKMSDESEGNERMVFNKIEIQNIINILNQNKTNPNTKEDAVYYNMRRYQLLEIAGTTRLIRKIDDKHPNILIILATEELFDEILTCHLAVGHGGVDKTAKETKKKFANIQQKHVLLFNSLCMGCQKKRTKAGNKKVVVKPIISDGFMTRGQLDLIDYQSMPDGIWKWAMHYQDHSNKLSVLDALTTKCAREVAYRLIPIFTLIGCPFLLQMDNGREFVANIINLI